MTASFTADYNDQQQAIRGHPEVALQRQQFRAGAGEPGEQGEPEADRPAGGQGGADLPRRAGGLSHCHQRGHGVCHER